MTPPAGDAGLARWLAVRAGAELVRLRAGWGGADPAGLRDAGDQRSHDLLVRALARWRPSDAVLSEEAVRDDVAARRSATRVWIIDPLDGTREFGEPGRTDWAVHVALWSRTGAAPAGGGGLVAGAVALPAQDRVFATDQPPGWPPPGRAEPGRPLRVAVSRSRPPVWLAQLARSVGAEPVPIGSAGAKVAAVITGEVDAYLHAGGQFEWDSAAPVAVARATGLHTSRLDGSTLEYNQVDPRLPDLLVCRRELADQLLAAVARYGRGKG